MPPPPDRRNSSSGRPKGGRPTGGKPPARGGKPPARGGKPPTRRDDGRSSGAGGAKRGGRPAGPGKPAGSKSGGRSGRSSDAGRPTASGRSAAGRTASGRPAGPSRAGGSSGGSASGRPAGASRAGGSSGGRPTSGRPAGPSRSSSSGRPSSGRPAGSSRSSERGRPSGDDRDRERRDDGRKGVPAAKGRGGAWGGLARRAAGAGGTNAPLYGSGRIKDDAPSSAADAFRAASGRADGDRPHEREEVQIVRVDDVQQAARGAVKRGSAATRPAEERTGRPSRKATKLAEELADHVGPSTAPKLGIRLADAGRAFEAERYLDAKRILAGLVKRAPASAAVRELNGLTLYRLGKWEAAVKELEAFRALTGSTEQHPVLADCYRALGRWDAVESLWHELREASPSAELVAEGRIVFAGSLADRDDVPAAIAVIEPATRRIRGAHEHHLRLLYVLGDLYERVGEVPRARAAFDRVVAADPGFGDATARRRALS